MIWFHCTEVLSYHFKVWIAQSNTVDPRFNEHLFNEVLDITNNILRPGESNSKRYNEHNPEALT